MADGTPIEWTDATWQPITGCSVVSPGCTNCYAMRLAGTRLKHHPSRAGLTRDTKAGPVWTGDVRFNEQWLDQPLKWRTPRRIFVCAHGDLFAEGVPDEAIDRVFAVMALAPQHTFQVLTKRAERMRGYLAERHSRNEIELAAEAMWPNTKPPFAPKYSFPWPLPNVWLGVSVEDQARADERIPHLLATPAAVRFISAEPLLGPVDVFPFVSLYAPPGPSHNGLDWIICGGESGPNARPMHPDWARSLRDQCAAAGVPFFFKQFGVWAPSVDDDSYAAYRARGARDTFTFRDGAGVDRVGKKAAGRLLDRRTHDEFPA